MTDTTVPRRLVDGTEPMSPDALLELLAHHNIDQTTLEHAPVFTVEEAKAIRGTIDGAHTKNLFLRNKKGRMWMVTCLEDRAIDLKTLAVALDAKNFSFASPERLMQYLGVIPGSVTPFAVVNDVENKVTLVLDAALKQIQPLNFHPLDNARTTAISTDGLLQFLEVVNHPPVWLSFPDLRVVEADA